MTQFLAFSPGGSRRMTQTSIKVFFERKLKEVNGDDSIPHTPPAAAAVSKPTVAAIKKGIATAADKGQFMA